MHNLIDVCATLLITFLPNPRVWTGGVSGLGPGTVEACTGRYLWAPARPVWGSARRVENKLNSGPLTARPVGGPARPGKFG